MHLRWGLWFSSLFFPARSHSMLRRVSEGQAPAATFKAETRAVDVDVVVLDSHGEPVKGLRKEDFAITEDGSPQTATFFEEHTSDDGQPDTAANVLLIDTLNTPKEDLDLRPQAVADF